MANGGRPSPADAGVDVPTGVRVPQAVDESGLADRREELVRLEERLRARESALDARRADTDAREQTLARHERDIDQAKATIADTRKEQLRQLERTTGMSVGEARRALLDELAQELRHEQAVQIRQVEDETRHDAERRARSILATCMQRIAGGHSAELTAAAAAMALLLPWRRGVLLISVARQEECVDGCGFPTSTCGKRPTAPRAR